MQRRIILGIYGCAAILCVGWYGYQSYWLGQIQRFQHSHDRLYMQVLADKHQVDSIELITNEKKYPSASTRHYVSAWQRCDSLINASMAALGSDQYATTLDLVLADSLVREFSKLAAYNTAHLKKANDVVTDSIELLLLKSGLGSFLARKTGAIECGAFNYDIFISPSIFGAQKDKPQDILFGLWERDIYQLFANYIFIVDGDTLPNQNGSARYKHRFDSPGMHPVQVQLIRKNYPSDTTHIFSRTFQINVKQ